MPDTRQKFLVRESINIAFWDFKKSNGDSSTGEENDDPEVVLERLVEDKEGNPKYILCDGGTYKTDATDILYSGNYGSVFSIRITNGGSVQFDLNETEFD